MQFPEPGTTVLAHSRNGLIMRVKYDPRTDPRNPDPSPWLNEYGGRLPAHLFYVWQECAG